MRPLVRRLIMQSLIPVAAAAALAACGSGSGSGGSTAAAGASGSTSSAPAATDTSAAVAQVKQVWEEFFSKDTPISQKETLLQNGTTAMAPAVQAFASNPMTSQVTANVSKVSFPTPTTASVTYDIELSGATVMSSVPGQAVEVNGQWLVSDTSLCSLLQLAVSSGGSASAIPGCS